MRSVNKTKIIYPNLDKDSDFASKLGESLKNESEKKLGANAIAFLLSFHDDGVVWGRIENGDLQTSDFPDSPSPVFRVETLQECRLFNVNGELLVWRVGEKAFKARWIIDGDGKDDEYFDEAQVLHGTQIDRDKDGKPLANGVFTVAADGMEGLRHAFPRKVEDEDFIVKDEKGKIVKAANGKETRKRPLRLCVRHYLSYDEDGCAYVSLSRLVNVEVEGGK